MRCRYVLPAPGMDCMKPPPRREIAGILAYVCLLLASTRTLDWNQGRRRSACGPGWMIRLDNVVAYRDDMFG